MASAIAMLDSVGLHDLTEVASRLSELVECSMIVSEGSAQSPRFRMLEAQRFYALEKLQAHGEHERCASEHAAHVAALFEASYLGWDSAPDAAWIAGYGPERDNLRAAIRFAAAASDATLLARLVGSSIWLWRAIGAMHELRQLLQHPLLQATAPAASQARLKLALAYSLHATSSESSSVQSAAAQAVTAFEGVDDVIGAANSLLCLASAFAQLGSTAMHQACLDRIDAVLREHRSGKAYAWYCGSHAWAAQLGGNVRAALSWASRSRAAYRDCHARHGETRAMLHLADLRLAAGEVERAIAMGQECVGRLQGDLHREDLGRALANLGAAWFARGDLDQARSCWARALDELRRLDFSYWVFDHIALLAIAEGRDDDAAQMLGYAEAGYIRFRKGRRVQNEQRAHDQALAHLEARHSAEELAMWLTAGATASEDAVIALATQPGIARAG
jgi:tetratricopeptide (TPR) repeat protein